MCKGDEFVFAAGGIFHIFGEVQEKKLKTITEPLGKFPEKSSVSSVVTEILSFRRVDRQTDRHRSTFYYRYPFMTN